LHVGLCIPVYDGRVHDATMSSVARTMQEAQRKGITISLIMGRGNAVLPHVRNWLVSQAMLKGCDKIWFVDSDMAWDGCIPDVLNMLAAPVDVVAGVHQARNPRWNDPARLVVKWDKIPPEQDEATGLLKVSKVATAFVCIDRSVFERIDKAGLARPYLSFGQFNPDPSMKYMRAYFWYDFLSPAISEADQEKLREYGVDGPFDILQGEDFYFCDRVKDVGGSIFIDPRIALTHFDGCVQHTASFKDIVFQSEANGE